MTMAWTYLGFALLLACDQGAFFPNEDEQNVSSIPASAYGDGLIETLGKASAADESALSEVHAELTTLPPASIRLDPDLYVSSILEQFHPEKGLPLAQALASLQGYRLLLGGASVDFQSPPKEDFDATSLLAHMRVAKGLCKLLINPDNGVWESILPSDNWQSNVEFLVQRFWGRQTSSLDDGFFAGLRDIYDSSGGDYELLCTAIILDVEALSL